MVLLLLLTSWYILLRHVIAVCTDQLKRPDSSDNVRHLVASLYRTINSEQYFDTKQRMLLAQQQQIRLQLEPLEKVCLLCSLT